jgi:type IV pilus assembly protein PilM
MVLRSGNIQPIGLDIGHDSVKMLQLDVGPRGLAVRAAALRPLDSANAGRGEQGLDAALAIAGDMLRRGGFVGRTVVTALPREIVHVKNLRLPVIPADELPAAVRFEARNIFSFDTSAAYVNYLVAGEVRQGADARQEVIVMAARQPEVDDYLDRLDRIGVLVASLDAEPCALYRGIERFVRRRDDEQEVNVLIDVGLRRTQVVIGRGREISFYKPIDIGGQRLNDIIRQKLEITFAEARALRRRLAAAPAAADSQESVRQAVFNATRGILEELAREISLCLRYHSVTFRGPGPSRVRLLGGEAHDPNLRAILSASLSMTVEAAQPLFNVDCSALRPADRQGPMSEWATVLGLALKKTVGRFPALDGTPRTPRQPLGEVIDLNQAVASAAEAKGSPGQAKAAPPEVANA